MPCRHPAASCRPQLLAAPAAYAKGCGGRARSPQSAGARGGGTIPSREQGVCPQSTDLSPMSVDRSSIHTFIIHDSKIGVKIYGYCLSMVFTVLLGAYCS